MKDCADCTHFRSAPYEAKNAGCYHPKNLVGKQKDAYLDEQQTPGDHEQINRNGDCAEFEARPSKPPFLKRLFASGE